jgi:two-component system, OmpR family, copper resistance phosphate regulon response regulator CusR
MHVLIIEDEPKVVEFIRRGLEENGFETQVAYDGELGLRIATQGSFDAIIMDVNLPQINGFELCKRLRMVNEHVPILMLTALGTTEDKLAGFESGADDYLLKPFEFRELLARLRALLKRSSPGMSNQGNLLKVADLEMDLDTKMVKRGDKRIDLTAKEFALLEFFMKNKGRIVNRIEIAEQIWDITFETGTNVIDVYVNFLRKKIDKEFENKLIHTQIGMGYILRESE